MKKLCPLRPFLCRGAICKILIFLGVSGILYELMKEFAVIKTGGKQYKVSAGDTVTVEKLSDEHKEGDKVTFGEVLLIDGGKASKLGAPAISGAKVSATVLAVGKAKKVVVIRYKAKSRYFKKRGHRQPFVKVKINSIA